MPLAEKGRVKVAPAARAESVNNAAATGAGERTGVLKSGFDIIESSRLDAKVSGRVLFRIDAGENDGGAAAEDGRACVGPWGTAVQRVADLELIGPVGGGSVAGKLHR